MRALSRLQFKGLWLKNREAEGYLPSACIIQKSRIEESPTKTGYPYPRH